MLVWSCHYFLKTFWRPPIRVKYNVLTTVSKSKMICPLCNNFFGVIYEYAFYSFWFSQTVLLVFLEHSKLVASSGLILLKVCQKLHAFYFYFPQVSLLILSSLKTLSILPKIILYFSSLLFFFWTLSIISHGLEYNHL